MHTFNLVDPEIVWPSRGLPSLALSAILHEVSALKSPYALEPPPFSYPGMILDPALSPMVADLIAKQLNNIGMHTLSGEGESGFDGTQRMERESVWMAASVIGGSRQTVDGYFCCGGTEANEWGLWIGREWLKKNVANVPRPETIVFMTPLTHYSVHKAIEKLAIGKPGATACPTCGGVHVPLSTTESNIALVGMNKQGEMLVEDLARLWRELYDQGYRRFILVANVGSTVLGSVDPVNALCAFVRGVHADTDARIFVHVDAAFAGFTVPFIDPVNSKWFANPEVMTVTFDADKMGHLPYPAGLAMCRKGLTEYISRHVEYVSGHRDDTIAGSRSAIAAVLAHYKWQQLGVDGQRAFVAECIAYRDQLVELITARLRPEQVSVICAHPAVNQLGLRVPNKRIGGHPALVPFAPRFDVFPSDPARVDSCPETVYKILVMPHTFRYFERFADALVAAISETP